MHDRCVAHIDMDAFYVAVELRRAPELRGRPVIVAGNGPRAVVTTASYEARRFGVGSAMPAARARRLCPQGVFVSPDFAHYREVSGRVMGILRGHVERVEAVGFDEAYLDLTGLPAPHATMRMVCAEIERQEGLSCSVGIGPSKLVAKVASDAEKPRGFVVLTREQACARFASAPPALVPGIGPKTAARLVAIGIESLGQLAAAPPAELAARFGPRLGAELARRARFEDDTPVCQERRVVSESRETTFDRDIADPRELERILAQLVERLCGALEQSGRSGRTVGIKIRLDDFSTHTRAHSLPQPVAAAERVGPVALELLRRFGPRRPVRLLGVRVAGLERGAEAQLTLLGRQRDQ
ncbi:MAG: DNA polymerase IV [Solirubrobacterales bacterium]|nr:DNA polymerase IV [Solirubrobacterales bacterium]